MKLNHLNLAVTNPSETGRFFEKYFGLRSMGGAPNENAVMVGLFDDDRMVLVLSNFGKATEVHYPPGFHIGFFLSSSEQVNEINERLKGDGFDVNPPGKLHGAWGFFFAAPGGIPIEVLHDISLS